MVYESDFYTVRRPYSSYSSRPTITSYSVTAPRISVSTWRVKPSIRTSVLIGELDRIHHRSRPHLGYIATEQFLNSRPLIDFDDETKHIRAETERLKRRIYTSIPHPRTTTPLQILPYYGQHATDKYKISRRYNTVPEDILTMSHYNEPSSRTIGRGHLACVSFAGGRGYPRRKHLYSDENRDIMDEIKFRSYYNKNRAFEEAMSLPTGFASYLLRLQPNNKNGVLTSSEKLQLNNILKERKEKNSSVEEIQKSVNKKINETVEIDIPIKQEKKNIKFDTSESDKGTKNELTNINGRSIEEESTTRKEILKEYPQVVPENVTISKDEVPETTQMTSLTDLKYFETLENTKLKSENEALIEPAKEKIVESEEENETNIIEENETNIIEENKSELEMEETSVSIGLSIGTEDLKYTPDEQKIENENSKDTIKEETNSELNTTDNEKNDESAMLKYEDDNLINIKDTNDEVKETVVSKITVENETEFILEPSLIEEQNNKTEDNEINEEDIENVQETHTESIVHIETTSHEIIEQSMLTVSSQGQEITKTFSVSTEETIENIEDKSNEENSFSKIEDQPNEPVDHVYENDTMDNEVETSLKNNDIFKNHDYIKTDENLNESNTDNRIEFTEPNQEENEGINIYKTEDESFSIKEEEPDHNSINIHTEVETEPLIEEPQSPDIDLIHTKKTSNDICEILSDVPEEA